MTISAKDWEQAVAESDREHQESHGSIYWPPELIKERAAELAAARISRAEFERDRMGETGERNAAARQASEPAGGDQTALDIACDAYNSVPQDGNGAEEAPMQAALAAAFPALVAEIEKLRALLSDISNRAVEANCSNDAANHKCDRLAAELLSKSQTIEKLQTQLAEAKRDNEEHADFLVAMRDFGVSLTDFSAISRLARRRKKQRIERESAIDAAARNKP